MLFTRGSLVEKGGCGQLRGRAFQAQGMADAEVRRLEYEVRLPQAGDRGEQAEKQKRGKKLELGVRVVGGQSQGM